MPRLSSLTLSTCSLFLLSDLMYSYLDDTQLHHSVCIYIYIFITHNIPPYTSHAYTSSQYSTKLLNLPLNICIFLLLRTPPKYVVFPPPVWNSPWWGKPRLVSRYSRRLRWPTRPCPRTNAPPLQTFACESLTRWIVRLTSPCTMTVDDLRMYLRNGTQGSGSRTVECRPYWRPYPFSKPSEKTWAAGPAVGDAADQVFSLGLEWCPYSDSSLRVAQVDPVPQSRWSTNGRRYQLWRDGTSMASPRVAVAWETLDCMDSLREPCTKKVVYNMFKKM
jgi:hypothetical protein